MTDNLLKIDYEKYSLANGLQVILYPDLSLPVAAVNIWYSVGSANENKDKTGFAHLFEHMMFQGSQNIPKEGHFRFIQEAGGSLNGSTSTDRTNYYETVPANYLELALWLESDRMGFMLPALTQEKLDNQKEVVMNERRQRYENQPYGRAWETLFSNLFSGDHPYHWPTIGWMEDIAKFELNDVKTFFQTYYVPNNSALVIGGNFEKGQAKELVDKYFSAIPKGSNNIPAVFVSNQTLQENKKIIIEDNVQLPRIYFAWHTEKAFDENDAALDILSDILSSAKNSRLHKALMFDKQIAQDVQAFQYSGKHAGSFIIVSTTKPGITIDTLKHEILNEIEKLINGGIRADELTRAKNSIKSSYIYSLQKLDLIVDHINYYNCYLNEPDSFVFDLGRYEKVTAEEVISSAVKYLKNPFIELNVIPKEK
jgi:zinc protease